MKEELMKIKKDNCDIKEKFSQCKDKLTSVEIDRDHLLNELSVERQCNIDNSQLLAESLRSNIDLQKEVIQQFDHFKGISEIFYFILYYLLIPKRGQFIKF